MSLDHARVQDEELNRLPASSDRAEQRQAYGILETEAAVAPPRGRIPACWGHPNASFRPLLLVGGALYRCDLVCRGATGVAKTSDAGTRASHF